MNRPDVSEFHEDTPRDFQGPNDGFPEVCPRGLPGEASPMETLRRYHVVDIGVARALPMSLYASVPAFEQELEKIFRRAWICVGRAEQVGHPGDYFTVEIAGEAIVVVRGMDGRLRALSSVCRHRYFSVVEGAGNTTRFTCAYHLWTYELDGQLRGAPHMPDVCDLRGEPVKLPEFSVDTWLGFVFVSLQTNPPPLMAQFASVEAHWQNYDIARWRVTPWIDEVWPGNWKLAMETALEGYHVTGLHRGTIDTFMPSRSAAFADHGAHWTLFRLDTVFKGDFASFKPYADRMSGPDQTSAPQFGFFPNCAVSCSQMSSIWLSFLPIDVGHTRVIGGNLVPPDVYDELMQDEPKRLANAEVVNAINAQDASAMVNLQKNVGSLHAEPGLLCEKERNLLDFYRYLSTQLDHV